MLMISRVPKFRILEILMRSGTGRGVVMQRQVMKSKLFEMRGAMYIANCNLGVGKDSAYRRRSSEILSSL